METRTGRRLSPKWLRLLVLPAALLVAPATAASAHQSSDLTPSGRSPFYAPYSFMNTGNYYGQDTHQDYTSSGHVNDNYALDLNPLVSGTCGRHLYSIWGNLTVKQVNPDTGFLRMEGSPTGSGVYQLEYRHMNSIAVSVGQRLDRGTFVGTVGQRGNATGCHLHLSARKSISGSWYSVRPVLCGHMVANRTSYPGCT